ncbi:cytochrome c oxidase subunit II [Altererythrobacter sp. BO-6]|uniref:cytochrome c oxidase subunit II n=1 Tax=Altererythrobacter sp. BO-6 TaxID=2604537 RepID=UPI0013E1BA46|nr:cytochrome c oxidase subunit II [Altererythrobacter sp. BO-6]QIG53330.1 cytochrome c oxidase subunit II [Altererythrobacter sp. BO-6]
MILRHMGRRAYLLISMLAIAVLLAIAPRTALAQDEAAAAAETTAVEAAPAYTPMAPTAGKGMPVDGRLGFQEQFSPNGDYALWMHDSILLPIITIISLFVLGLLLWVIVRYNRRANPTPSKTTHNTLIEVIWTVVPVIVLLVIAVPSIQLLAKQYQTPPEDAVTIKVTGYQWYWGYTYPDNGGFEVISNMLSAEDAVKAGEPYQLAVDKRMVVPANTPLRIQTTAADVIHAFAVPSLWFKLDAVPGRLNEKMLIIDEPGVYYGQCSELCGARHGFMPITVEALPRDQWEAWVREQGGTVAGDEVAAEAPATDAAAAAPAA